MRGRRARDHYEDWPLAYSLTAAMLRCEAGLSTTTYTTEEGSQTAEKFALLSTWASTESAQR